MEQKRFMVNITLDEEAEQYLVEILSQERTTSSELLKKLLRNYLQTHQPRQSVLARMGGVPKHLLSVGNLSDRCAYRTGANWIVNPVDTGYPQANDLPGASPEGSFTDSTSSSS